MFSALKFSNNVGLSTNMIYKVIISNINIHDGSLKEMICYSNAKTIELGYLKQDIVSDGVLAKLVFGNFSLKVNYMDSTYNDMYLFPVAYVTFENPEGLHTIL